MGAWGHGRRYGRHGWRRKGGMGGGAGTGEMFGNPGTPMSGGMGGGMMGGMGSPMGGGMMGGGMGGGGAMGGGGGAAGQVERNSVSQGTYQPQQGARAGLGQPMQSRVAPGTGNQRGVQDRFGEFTSLDNEFNRSSRHGWQDKQGNIVGHNPRNPANRRPVRADDAGWGGLSEDAQKRITSFNRRPPENFGPTGGFSTSTRTQDLGSPMGDGRGTGGDGRPVGGGPVGGGPIGQPSPMSPTPQPSAPRNYGGGFGMMSPYGRQQQPQINQDFSFSSNMFGQNPMMQMAQKPRRARAFAPRSGRSQSRVIGGVGNLRRQNRNLRFGWG